MPESRYHALISCPLIFKDIDQYTKSFAEHDITFDVANVNQQLNEQELLKQLPEYDGILAGDDEITRAVLKNSPCLKVISKWGIGTDNIDMEAAESHGVVVYNTPGAFSEEVADIVIGYTIMLARQLHQIDQKVRKGEWYCPRGISLSDRTLGIIGVGNIGSAVAERAAALGMDVLGNDVREISPELHKKTGIESVDREELLDRADVVSLNCALNEATDELIDAEALELLGPSGFLINTSRGGLVDQDVLVTALDEGKIAGAALDVFAEEPLPPTNPLTKMDNVILGSHNAQNTEEAVSRTHDRAVANLIEGLTENRPAL